MLFTLYSVYVCLASLTLIFVLRFSLADTRSAMQSATNAAVGGAHASSSSSSSSRSSSGGSDSPRVRNSVTITSLEVLPLSPFLLVGGSDGGLSMYDLHAGSSGAELTGRIVLGSVATSVCAGVGLWRDGGGGADREASNPNPNLDSGAERRELLETAERAVVTSMAATLAMQGLDIEAHPEQPSGDTQTAGQVQTIGFGTSTGCVCWLDLPEEFGALIRERNRRLFRDAVLAAGLGSLAAKDVRDGRGQEFVLTPPSAGSDERNVVQAHAVGAWVTALLLVPQLACFLSSGSDGLVCVVDPSRRRVSRTFLGHKHSRTGCLGLAYSAATGYVASAADRTVLVWDPYTLDTVASIDRFGASIQGLRHSHSMGCFLVLCADGSVQVIHALHHTIVTTLRLNSSLLGTLAQPAASAQVLSEEEKTRRDKKVASALCLSADEATMYTADHRLSKWQLQGSLDKVDTEVATTTATSSNSCGSGSSGGHGPDDASKGSAVEDDIRCVLFNAAYLVILVVRASGAVTVSDLAGTTTSQFAVALLDEGRGAMGLGLGVGAGRLPQGADGLPVGLVVGACLDAAQRRLLVAAFDDRLLVTSIFTGTTLYCVRPIVPAAVGNVGIGHDVATAATAIGTEGGGAQHAVSRWAKRKKGATASPGIATSTPTSTLAPAPRHPPVPRICCIDAATIYTGARGDHARAVVLLGTSRGVVCAFQVGVEPAPWAIHAASSSHLNLSYLVFLIVLYLILSQRPPPPQDYGAEISAQPLAVLHRTDRASVRVTATQLVQRKQLLATYLDGGLSLFTLDTGACLFFLPPDAPANTPLYLDFLSPPNQPQRRSTYRRSVMGYIKKTQSILLTPILEAPRRRVSSLNSIHETTSTNTSANHGITQSRPSFLESSDKPGPRDISKDVSKALQAAQEAVLLISAHDPYKTNSQAGGYVPVEVVPGLLSLPPPVSSTNPSPGFILCSAAFSASPVMAGGPGGRQDRTFVLCAWSDGILRLGVGQGSIIYYSMPSQLFET